MEDNSPTGQLHWLKARVDKLLSDRNHTTKWLYERIGMTKTGYRQMWERDTVKFATMVAIAKQLKVSLAELVTEGAAMPTMAMDPPATYGSRYLEDRVQDLEQRVSALERRK